jgi:hypothetical protein
MELLFSTRFFMVRTESCKCKFVAVDSMKAYRSSKHMPSVIINLKIRYKGVVNFTPLLIYAQERPSLHTHWRVGWLQKQDGDFEGEKNHLPLPGFEL